MRRETVWGWWIVAGVLATAGYYLLPTGGFAANLVYNGIGLMSVVAILGGARLHRPRNPAVWYWFAAGQATWVAGDLMYEYYEYVLHQSPYPSFADVLYLASYPMLAVGLWLLVRGRGGGAARLADAAIAGIGVGLALWIFVLHPIATDSTASALERAISTAYPAADVLILALLARLLVNRGGTASTRLLGVAVLLLLAADVAYSVVSFYADGDDHLLSGGWLLSYVLWGAASLHPSITVQPAREEGAARVGWVQFATLTGCALLAPVMLFIPGVGDNTVDRLAIGAGSVVLFLLSVTRVLGLSRTVQGQTAELARIALHDDLTGLPNRRHFEQALGESVPGGGSLHVVFLGLSGLKNINDELGRPVGDQVVAVSAARIFASAPEATRVARIGGDEFAVALPDAATAERVAQRLVAVLREPVRAGGHELLAGASIGVAEAGGVAEVLRRAEAAMHAAKRTGDPYRFWSAALDERAGEHARLGAELRAALDAGQFQVVYQPIVRMPEARVTAVEALVRWQHPQRGQVSPAAFIPVAEQNGLIVELGAWILHTACERMARWRAELGPAAPDRVSVNVSARQLARADFPATVAAALADTGLPPQCLTVEVTETAVFGGGQALTALHELRALGVRIALDDFGTGHSSLGLLQTVPVDVLKVDKSFVDNITEAGRHTVIARALIQVSDGLGLTAVAEGVETAEQAAALYDLGYRLLQGYYFGKPSAEPQFLLEPAAAANV
ncbi:bifunctional diguanylate cyclase/phosphodiesterase [Actinoplanes oblitus]|uniref:Bifunctional diguanylate cyclase/phosphodiesterase n=1 Tax=Actinoplanes oblitus TaxID=3040509 RepID=A0ABY8WRU8_9ACTN|nr:bifunctional diguanylate cyclase/phosphodiesterase [Actinoplanes oblitus]WIM99721.1 bifunctional diguanylate cyclase/phosphodiesterase [Actinoplanes oblitus]